MSGDDPRDDPNFSTNWDPEAWMPERAALSRKYGKERHLHFPEHLQPLTAAINRLYFDHSHLPWLKEAAARARLKDQRKRIVAALRRRTSNRQQGSLGGVIDAAPIPPRDRGGGALVESGGVEQLDE